MSFYLPSQLFYCVPFRSVFVVLFRPVFVLCLFLSVLFCSTVICSELFPFVRCVLCRAVFCFVFLVVRLVFPIQRHPGFVRIPGIETATSVSLLQEQLAIPGFTETRAVDAV